VHDSPIKRKSLPQGGPKACNIWNGNTQDSIVMTILAQAAQAAGGVGNMLQYLFQVNDIEFASRKTAEAADNFDSPCVTLSTGRRLICGYPKARLLCRH
jgi:hypothetical protein